MKTYRLKKSLHLLRQALKMYRRKKNRLGQDERQLCAAALKTLQEALMEKDRTEAHAAAQTIEALYEHHLKKTPFEKVRDFILGLGGALVIAVLIRTMWFELMEIPTGSMRPTFAEGDRLIVSKTPFGINIPLKRGHFLFENDLTKRNATIVFTSAGMDVADGDHLYFYLFPGKKQFVKRMLGKPGDTLYFYGGKIYGIDADGKDITAELNPDFLSKIDHIPFIHLNGKREIPAKGIGNVFSPITIKQMNEPIAKLSLSASNHVIGELLPPFQGAFDDYYDVWGFKDYGMARLLTRAEVKAYTDVKEIADAPLYMEIIHHPTIKYPMMEREPNGKLYPSVGTTSSVIPLQEDHLKTLMSNLYTCRFIVKDGKGYRYGSSYKSYPPSLKGVPDGTYEFYYGKGYKVHMGGVLTALPKDHPLYQLTPKRVQLLFNLGIEMMTPFQPMSKDQALLPSRYVYYRDGDLYALGTPLFKKEDPTLITFLQQEHLRQGNAPTYRPHFPFEDPGPPLNPDGTLDITFIQNKGMKIPGKHYLALGDNFAMSSDSRDFGFVPEDNLRGAPDFIFWPPGKRFGPPLEVSYAWISKPRVIVWILAAIGFSIYYIVHRRRTKLPQDID